VRRLLLFDVDGTLVDVDGAGREALRGALLEVFGETGPIDEFDFHGKTDPAIVRGLLRAAGRPDREIDRRLSEVWERYLAGLDETLADRAASVRVCPGVRELVDRLRGDGDFALGLVTGNVREGARRKLRACRLHEHFRVGAYGSDSERREELPPLAMERAARRLGRRFSTGEVWIVGDTPEDVRCARSSGVRCLAVATGGYGVDELREHGAHRVAATLERVPEVVRILAG